MNIIDILNASNTEDLNDKNLDKNIDAKKEDPVNSNNECTNDDKLSIKGIDFLVSLKNQLDDNIRGDEFARNFCPYEDLRNKFDMRVKEYRNKKDCIDNIIDQYNTACTELEKILRFKR